MAINYFEFTRTDYEYFVKEGMLDKEYTKLLECKIKGYTRAKIADEMGYSIDNIDKMIQKLSKKIKKML